MKRAIILLTCIFLAVDISAQEGQDFTADRPGTLTGTNILPKGRIQLESGAAWERVRSDGLSLTNWTLNTSMLRWGFSDYAELRVTADIILGADDNKKTWNVNDATIGAKVKLFEGWKVVPAISLLTSISVPIGAASSILPGIGEQIGLLFSNEIASWCSICYEADLIWTGMEQPVLFWGVDVGFSLGKCLSLQVEEFNYISNGIVSPWAEVDLAFQLSPRVQLDLGTDIDLSSPGSSNNLMAGICWQLTRK